MNYTEHYNLNQWEASDKVQRTDFNADNAKIDAAIKAVESRMEYGTYVGTGTFGETEGQETVLRLGYQPKLLFIAGAGGGMATFVRPCTNTAYVAPKGDGELLRVVWLEDGLLWHLPNTIQKTAHMQLNAEGVTYYYVAFR